MEKYDLIVIGGGPAGYVASICAAQAGLKVVCIDKNKNLGGTCLNVGCIPSKRLLYSSKVYKNINENINNHGIEVSSVKLNLKKMMIGKEEAVDKLTKGIDFLFKKNKVKRILGVAEIDKNKVVKVNKNKIYGDNIILATGSFAKELPQVKIDEKYILSSTGALSLKKVPKNLAVIGGGYIGLELGSVWSRLGSDVTVIEYLDTIVPSMDKDISKILNNELKKQGLKFKLLNEVISSKINKKNIVLKLKDLKLKKINSYNFDKVLLAIGRNPSTSGVQLKKLGIKLNKNGYIDVNQFYETSVKDIYAIGDIIMGPMLAHKASAEAQAVIDIIIGKKGQVNYSAIPAVIYTNPEVAWVGKSQSELDVLNIDYNIGKFEFSSNSRSKVHGNTVGMVKVISDTKSKRILGAHIIGENASEMIGELVVAMELGASAEDIALICHAHPTLSESIKEASSISAFGKTVHI